MIILLQHPMNLPPFGNHKTTTDDSTVVSMTFWSCQQPLTLPSPKRAGTDCRTLLGESSFVPFLSVNAMLCWESSTNRTTQLTIDTKCTISICTSNKGEDIAVFSHHTIFDHATNSSRSSKRIFSRPPRARRTANRL